MSTVILKVPNRLESDYLAQPLLNHAVGDDVICGALSSEEAGRNLLSSLHKASVINIAARTSGSNQEVQISAAGAASPLIKIQNQSGGESEHGLAVIRDIIGFVSHHAAQTAKIDCVISWAAGKGQEDPKASTSGGEHHRYHTNFPVYGFGKNADDAVYQPINIEEFFANPLRQARPRALVKVAADANLVDDKRSTDSQTITINHCHDALSSMRSWSADHLKDGDNAALLILGTGSNLGIGENWNSRSVNFSSYNNTECGRAIANEGAGSAGQKTLRNDFNNPIYGAIETGFRSGETSLEEIIAGGKKITPETNKPYEQGRWLETIEINRGNKKQAFSSMRGLVNYYCLELAHNKVIEVGLNNLAKALGVNNHRGKPLTISKEDILNSSLLAKFKEQKQWISNEEIEASAKEYIRLDGSAEADQHRFAYAIVRHHVDRIATIVADIIKETPQLQNKETTLLVDGGHGKGILGMGSIVKNGGGGMPAMQNLFEELINERLDHPTMVKVKLTPDKQNLDGVDKILARLNPQ